MIFARMSAMSLYCFTVKVSIKSVFDFGVIKTVIFANVRFIRV